MDRRQVLTAGAVGLTAAAINSMGRGEPAMAFTGEPTSPQEFDIPYKSKVKYNAEDTVLCIVDMQNDFVKPGGKLVVPDAEATVGAILVFANSLRAAGGRVVYTRDTHTPDDMEFSAFPEHCLKGSDGWQIVPDLTPQEGEFVFDKVRYSGFYGTPMDHYLKIWGVKNFLVCGTVSNICVLHSAGDAALRYYQVGIAADTVSAITEFDQALALREISFLYVGDVVRSWMDFEWL